MKSRSNLGSKSIKAQTAIEYAMLLAAIILPLAAVVNSMIESEEENESMVRKIVSNAYGNESSLGIIGRPYP